MILPHFCPHCGRPSDPDLIQKGKFVSRSQWAWCFAEGKEFCRRWAHNTPGGPKVRYRTLPGHVAGKEKKGKGGKRKVAKRVGAFVTQ